MTLEQAIWLAYKAISKLRIKNYYRTEYIPNHWERWTKLHAN